MRKKFKFELIKRGSGIEKYFQFSAAVQHRMLSVESFCMEYFCVEVSRDVDSQKADLFGARWFCRFSLLKTLRYYKLVTKSYIC
jgi:hypothetical protein